MTSAYWEAAKQSYANQEGGVTISADRLDEIVEIPLGFQPLGICHSFVSGRKRIAIAAYYEPAICIADLTGDENGLHFQTSWIRGVDHGIQSVRLFLDISQPGGANRAQTINFDREGRLWVTRNSERDFFILAPSASGGKEGRWTLREKVSLPGPKGEYQMVHSASREGNRLFTIESPGSLQKWFFCEYEVKDSQFIALERHSIKAWRYGIAFRFGAPWTVTDFRSKEKHGIYCENKLVVPGVEANGLCFLKDDGSALVTRYGQSHPGAFNGVPGALIYVPSHFFDK